MRTHISTFCMSLLCLAVVAPVVAQDDVVAPAAAQETSVLEHMTVTAEADGDTPLTVPGLLMGSVDGNDQLVGVTITSADDNAAGLVILQGYLAEESQRPLVTAAVQESLQKLIDQGAVKWPHEAAPVVDAKQMMVGIAPPIPPADDNSPVIGDSPAIGEAGNPEEIEPSTPDADNSAEEGLDDADDIVDSTVDSADASGSSYGADYGTTGYGTAGYGAGYGASAMGGNVPMTTWYDPYYYGYYGVFYNEGAWGFRGWNIARRWKPAYPVGAPVGYPQFHYAHYARYPGHYWNPYRHYPTYMYTSGWPTTNFYYPNNYPYRPMMITQPYIPMVGMNEVGSATQTRLAAQQSQQTQAASQLTSENIALLATRGLQATGFEFVSVGRHDSVELPEEVAFLYDRGYHAYWRGDYKTAHEVLGHAADASTQDARILYYLGLSEIALGDNDAALRTLGAAVQTHIEHPGQNAAVGQSLERIQGKLRIQLQRARLQVEQQLRDGVRGRTDVADLR